jgi:hypothetical protein
MKKQSYERARQICFVLSILAALLAALASQLPEASNGAVDYRLWLSVTSSCMLAVVAVITAQQLSTKRMHDWIHSRAVSEAFKRIAYTYAAQAAPYELNTTRAHEFSSAVASIMSSLNELAPDPRAAKTGKTPQKIYASAQEYLLARPKAQSAHYRTAARKCADRAARLRSAEFVLALVCAVITAAIGVAGKVSLGGEISFDFVALTGVLTTLSGSILAYREASRADFLSKSFAAAADELDVLIAALPNDTPYPGPDWSAFVQKVENVLATENSAWLAKMGAP